MTKTFSSKLLYTSFALALVFFCSMTWADQPIRSSYFDKFPQCSEIPEIVHPDHPLDRIWYQRPYKYLPPGTAKDETQITSPDGEEVKEVFKVSEVERTRDEAFYTPSPFAYVDTKGQQTPNQRLWGVTTHGVALLVKSVFQLIDPDSIKASLSPASNRENDKNIGSGNFRLQFSGKSHLGLKGLSPTQLFEVSNTTDIYTCISNDGEKARMLKDEGEDIRTELTMTVRTEMSLSQSSEVLDVMGGLSGVAGSSHCELFYGLPTGAYKVYYDSFLGPKVPPHRKIKYLMNAIKKGKMAYFQWETKNRRQFVSYLTDRAVGKLNGAEKDQAYNDRIRILTQMYAEGVPDSVPGRTRLDGTFPPITHQHMKYSICRAMRSSQGKPFLRAEKIFKGWKEAILDELAWQNRQDQIIYQNSGTEDHPNTKYQGAFYDPSCFKEAKDPEVQATENSDPQAYLKRFKACPQYYKDIHKVVEAGIEINVDESSELTTLKIHAGDIYGQWGHIFEDFFSTFKLDVVFMDSFNIQVTPESIHVAVELKINQPKYKLDAALNKGLPILNDANFSAKDVGISAVSIFLNVANGGGTRQGALNGLFSGAGTGALLNEGVNEVTGVKFIERTLLEPSNGLQDKAGDRRERRRNDNRRR